MKIVYDPRHVFYSPKSEFDRTMMVNNPETPQRIEEIIKVLKFKYGNSFVKPKDFPKSYIYLAHDSNYISWLKNRCDSLEDMQEYFPKVFGYDRVFDNGTPLMKNSFEMAWMGVKCALTGAYELLNGVEDIVYVGTRPPGHHAGIDMGGGYCYMNNSAIAAKFLQMKSGGTVAVLDLDFHHGNGTQEIFYEDSSVLYISLHADPAQHFPFISGYEWEIGEGEGKGYNINFPLAGGTDGRTYLRTLEKAVQEIQDYDPSYLIVSLGTDTHKDDPLGNFMLGDSDFFEIGKLLSELDIFKLVIQEGGYNPVANASAVDSFMAGLLI